MAQCVPLNPRFGVSGLPQSGTGQTAIFTGVNAPKLIGRHFGPYPTTELRPVLAEQNLLKRALQRGKSVAFANAFPKQFFDYVEKRRNRLSVTTLSCNLTGIPLRTADDLRIGDAVSADITRERWVQLGYPDILPVSAQEAGKTLASIAARNDFTLFEYWLTDHAGHAQDMETAKEVLERFDTFFESFVANSDMGEMFVILTSDHGNIEDCSVKTHTLNHVPCLMLGRNHREAALTVRSLLHVTPLILNYLQS